MTGIGPQISGFVHELLQGGNTGENIVSQVIAEVHTLLPHSAPFEPPGPVSSDFVHTLETLGSRISDFIHEHVPPSTVEPPGTSATIGELVFAHLPPSISEIVHANVPPDLFELPAPPPGPIEPPGQVISEGIQDILGSIGLLGVSSSLHPDWLA